MLMSTDVKQAAKAPVLLIMLLVVIPVSAQVSDPTDWSDWETYRGQVTHPCSSIKPADLERARRNIEQYEWARKYADSVRRSADSTLELLGPEYLEQMVPWKTPGGYGPCPACRAQGIPWHPNGQWSWSSSRPEEIKCKICGTVFPNDEYPESVTVESTWGRGQTISFYGGDTFKTFGYRYERPSFTGMIRRYKISNMLSRLRTLGTACALTGDPAYARGAKEILLRFAEVFPGYLVRAGYGYGEYAGMDPHVAAKHINDLPEDELVYPPNKPDRKLYTGYWSASRLGTSGMDGGYVTILAEAYDLTCAAEDGGQPVYSEDERILIERDVLLEASYLAACDNSINNKSVGNRAGAAIVGMVVGHPGLVHFGLDGFKRTVNDWFLPDGGTSESPAYAMMTMGGIRKFALVFRDYSDPTGYAAPDGSRLDGFNAARDTLYGNCWQGLIWTLQGNLRFPPSADSYRTSAIGSTYGEMIEAAYPTDEHLALLQALSGGEKPGSVGTAIFYREPGSETHEVAPFSLPDVVFPYLSQGYLRTGETGRDSLAMLNASDWGGHHHYDSLNLYYWQDGHELLSDLGYLWDHPDSKKTRRTWAHNLVMLDQQGQRHGGRGGSFDLFSTTPRVKAMEASSTAYANASEYRRTCVQIDHGEAGSYLVDIFRAAGGYERDYVFHGPGNDYAVDGLDLAVATSDEEEREVRFALRLHLGAVGEMFVDDVEIHEVAEDGTEGPNLAPNPSVADGEEGKLPPGWGCYHGDGTAEWGAATPGQADDRCARIEATATDANGRVNVALLCGDSDGYRGANAIVGTVGAKYRVRFSLRGSASNVSVGTVAWPHDPMSADDRNHASVDMGGPVAAGDDWRTYEGSFTLLGKREPLMTDPRQASGTGPWNIAWTLEEGYRFEAFAPGAEGETVIVGDGWGQRDHRNSDRGATLPYIVRRRTGAEGADIFAMVFVGGPADAELVRGVTRLPLPDDAPAGAIALAIETSEGTDVVVSMTNPAPLTVATPVGDVTSDGRLAVVIEDGRAPSAACLVAGNSLEAGGVEVALAEPSLSGNIIETGSEAGGSWFEVDAVLPTDGTLVGSVLFVDDGQLRRGYPIRGVRQAGEQTRVLTKVDGVGFEARTAETWRIPMTSAWVK